jgi:crossover junction endodeoxyribonuclease RuvC
MKVLGVDPGTARMGYGVVERNGGTLKLCDYGCLETTGQKSPGQRLEFLYISLGEVVKKHRPSVMSVEALFFSKNVKSAFAVGQARGVALLLAAQREMSVAEYTPLQVKSALVGYGKAEKAQVQYMVQQLLKMAELPEPDDASDALALAICHAHTLRS